MKIYNAGPYWVGLTDLVYFNNEYYVCFRRADKHMFCESNIWVFKSKDGKKWDNYAESQHEDDLRDPRFIIENNKLYLLATYCKTENDKVKYTYILKGVIRKDHIILMNTGIENAFVASVENNDLLCYDPVNNGNNSIISLDNYSVTKIKLPSFPDSTEITGYNNKYFVRRDNNNSYWLELDKKKGYKITMTDYNIHCPLLIEKGKYLLGREMSINNKDQYDWEDEYETRKMYIYKVNGYKLKKYKRLEGYGDCGYFGYANGIISYHASLSKENPKDISIFIEKL